MEWTEEWLEDYQKKRGIKNTLPKQKSKTKAPALPVPSESEEQQALFEWANGHIWKYPVLKSMFAIPNGGSRGKAEAGIFKAEGVKAGVPDIMLPAPRGRYSGLFIEMKKTKGGKISDDQIEWIGMLTSQGYLCKVCKGFEPARELILLYLKENTK